MIGSVPTVSAGSEEKAEKDEFIDIDRWTSPRNFLRGKFSGVRPTDRARSLTMAYPIGQREYTDPYGFGTKTWNYSRWTSPTRSVTFGAKQLIASWTADIPQGTWLEVEMQGTTTSGNRTGWYVMGRWATTDKDIHRTCVFGQDNEYGDIAIDTFKAADGVRLQSYQLRVTLYQLPESDHSPVLRSVSAMTSRLPEQEHVDASPRGGAGGITLDVPEYSQSIHAGEYPRWNGGGEAWCSPTSTAMVVSYWGRGPTKEQMSWVDPAYKDPQVDFAARGTFDYGYDGAGNWPFNIAYAGRFGMEGYVTRLYSLNELEQYIKAGIPVITSQSFEEEELPGAGYGTNGHLMVVVGFTDEGNVVANDPVAPTNDDVRVVYPREAFENVWQRTSGTGGIAYIIHPPGHKLPDGAPDGQRNWNHR
ncbi:peptidase C39 family protein [Haladaptatus pallidirubidus]